MESMVCVGRQSRLVTNQQRAYDFIGHEWRLPLWSEDFLNFWAEIPPKYKVEQKLYKDVLLENDWGGVWKNIDINNKLIRPHSLRFIRLFVKLLSVPLGKKNWHSIEKKIFYYWMHPSYNLTITSYWKVLFDKHGQRNVNSWTVEQYMNKSGFKNVGSVSEMVRKQYNSLEK